ncbi:Domain of unknown function DUF3835 [Ceraceosorus bombacis]|uniref:DUF3835 domain-containing protein n=1 Tax=Ceraceosorus bombacis TaxID=401625 RepID=A0A0P1BA49_9BASI|nr:Domain of unknown function DUF3835 [Ceraceosorus bombacis]
MSSYDGGAVASSSSSHSAASTSTASALPHSGPLQLAASEMLKQEKINSLRSQLKRTKNDLNEVERVQKALAELQLQRNGIDADKVGHGNSVLTPLGSKALQRHVPVLQGGAGPRLRIKRSAISAESAEEPIAASQALQFLQNRRSSLVEALKRAREQLDALVLGTDQGASASFESQQAPPPESVDEKRALSIASGVEETSGQSQASASATRLAELLQRLGINPDSDSARDGTDEQGRVLNEEGLPFVDLVEQVGPEDSTLSPSQSTSTLQAASNHAPRQKGNAGDAPQGPLNSSTGSSEDSKGESRNVEDRIANTGPPTPSSQRPKPIRSALKRSSSVGASADGKAPTMMRSLSGLRRGWLNLNPSSPAADDAKGSSDYMSASTASPLSNPDSGSDPAKTSTKPKNSFKFLALNPGSPTASPTCGQDALTGPTPGISAASHSSDDDDVGDRHDDRMSRSEPALPARVEQSPSPSQRSENVDRGRASVTPSKKSVRIKTPSHSRERTPGQTSPELVKSMRFDDDDSVERSTAAQSRKTMTDEKEFKGAEDEARRIVELLGPGVVRGHPSAPADLDRLEQAHLEDSQGGINGALASSAARISEEAEQATKKPAKPRVNPVQRTVMERAPRTKPTATPVASSDGPIKKESAFAKGFLNRPSKAFSASPSSSRDAARVGAPAGPSQIAATETNSDSKFGDVPQAPKQSFGMTALDRALQADEDELASREKSSLADGTFSKANLLPHARPSKAFKEKMEREAEKHKGRGKRGEDEVWDLKRPEDTEEYKDSEDGGEGRVRFADRPQIVGEDPSIRPAASTTKEQFVLARPAIRFADRSGRPDGSSTSPKQLSEIDAGEDEGGSERDIASEDGSEDLVRNSDLGSDFDEEDIDSDSSEIDLEELAPTLESMLDDFESAELAREYELARARISATKARLGASVLRGTPTLGNDAASDDDTDAGDDAYDDGRDIVSARHGSTEGQLEGSDGKRMSRFKSERYARAAGFTNDRVAPHSRELSMRGIAGENEADAQADQAGHELAHLLSDARNVGPDGALDMSGSGQNPVMVLPRIAPVRYPKNARDLLDGSADEDASSFESVNARAAVRSRRVGAGGPVDLEGGSEEDEEAEDLAAVMGARLDLAQQQRESGKLPGTAARGFSTRKARSNAQDPPLIRSKRAAASDLPSSKGDAQDDQVAKPRAPQIIASSAQPAIASPLHSDAATPSATDAQGAEQPKKVSRFKAARQAAADSRASS